MPQFFSNKRLIVLLVSIIVLVAMIGFSMKDREELSWPEQFLNDVVGTSQSLLYKPAHSVAGFFENMADMKDINRQNEDLKSKLGSYVKISENVRTLKRENEELKRELQKNADLSDFKIRNARIIGRSPDRWNRSVFINQGSREGLQAGMAVISPEGFVGRVDKVSAFHASVQLISDKDLDNKISAIVEGKKRTFGTINGFDYNKKSLVLTEIPGSTTLKKGQKVITSGLGEAFPRGLLIGTVNRVETDSEDGTEKAYITPAAGLYSLDHVKVLERAMPLVDIEQFKVKGGGQ